MCPMIFREMRETDVPQVAAIEQVTFSRPWKQEDFLDSLKLDSTLNVVAVSEEDDQVLGYCLCYQSFEEGNIVNVAVSEEARRKGIARKMLQYSMEQGQKRGMETFFLEVRISNEPAIRLYEGLGFERAGRRKNFYSAPVEDAWIMICG